MRRGQWGRHVEFEMNVGTQVAKGHTSLGFSRVDQAGGLHWEVVGWWLVSTAGHVVCYNLARV